jgi:hypothetical protein
VAKESGKGAVTNLSVLILFGFFLMISSMLIVSGANVYNSVSRSMTAGSALRSSSAYLANRLRGCGDAEKVLIGSTRESVGATGTQQSLESGDMLILEENYDGDTYYTRIYLYDGWLRESFLWSEVAFYPEDGERIVEVEDFSVEKDGALVSYSFSYPDAPSSNCSIALRIA